MTAETDDLMFAEESADDADDGIYHDHPWKILIVDDEAEVHNVTKLALSNFTFASRPVLFLDAYSGAESVKLMEENPDVAIVLMDVVMENDHAGLDAVRAIRQEIGNHFVRIILRTGQPGQAPERDVITQYDINDYKEKTELTAKKLFTVIYTGLSSYRDLIALETNKRGLEKVIDSSANIFELKSVQQFSQGVLEQLSALLYIDRDAVMMHGAGVATTLDAKGHWKILAGTGGFADMSGKRPSDILDEESMTSIKSCMEAKTSQYGRNHFIGYFATRTGTENVIYVRSDQPISVPDRNLVELFTRNVAIALENLHLNQEIENTQKELVIMLSEAIERRSKETGNHVRRVAEYSRVLGRLAGLDEDEAQVLYLAAPLHDAGKIAIPDAVLNKPGQHTDAESVIMREHAAIGEEIFAHQDLPLLKAAAIIAGQHHEKWDGSGYPNKLIGEDIHIYGRIIAITDVFDALGSERCYKEPWELDDILELLRNEKSKHFDPNLVDLMLDNLDDFLAIRDRFADHPTGEAPDDLPPIELDDPTGPGHTLN